jgi:hypothetical protein
MKTRIVKREYADGKITFASQHKIGFGWETIREVDSITEAREQIIIWHKTNNIPLKETVVE